MKSKNIKLAFLLIALMVTAGACKNSTAMKDTTFKQISPKEIQDNSVKMIADDWLLITAGDKDNFNMMTASWSTIGYLWGQAVVFIFVRPQRYTYEFMENSSYFTLTVFEEKYRDILQFCGTKSGRDYNKVKETGLKPLFTELGNVYYEQARLVIECEKIYADFLKEDAFIDKTIIENAYPNRDFHKMYVGKILNVWVKE
ncbi:MAG: flavin reductase [Prevotellaceae bacterium]|jgi:flavin reductase (DIM6/NTAB) family NADH-FMN oxidoreductase RutF|nr:flavin reductase [Prevotellaceae bacterium]